MHARNWLWITALAVVLIGAQQPADAQSETARSATADADTLLKTALAETESALKDLDTAIAELQSAVEAEDPTPQESIAYNAQRLKLAVMVSERLAQEHNRETLTLALRWHAGERELQHELARRLLVAGLENTDEELEQVADGPRTNPEHPVSIWQAAFLEIVPTPVWSSAGGRARETTGRDRDRRGSGSRSRRGSPTTQRARIPERINPDAKPQEEDEDAPAVIVTERGRHAGGEPDRTRLAAEQKRFQSTVDSVNRKVTNILRGPYKIVRQIERGDRASSSLIAKYRRTWKKLVGVERKAETDKRADQERLDMMRENLTAELAEVFRAICRDAAEKGAVSPLVEIMLIEDGAPDSLSRVRTSWAAQGARGDENTRKVIEDYIKPPAEDDPEDQAADEDKDDVDPNDPNAADKDKDEKAREKVRPATKPKFLP